MNGEKDIEKKVVICVEGLYKHFGENHVLNGFHMELLEAENLVIMGKSGSGKSVSVSYVTNNQNASHTIQAISMTYGLADRR